MSIRYMLYRGAERIETAARLLKCRLMPEGATFPPYATYCQDEDHICSVPDWP